jgi:ribosomal protein S18 acetylase RimI-like enzyme
MSVLAGLRRATMADVTDVTDLQHAAYAGNRAILGVEPLPLIADYAEIIARDEVWLLEGEGLEGVLVLTPRADDLLIWSVATAPGRRGGGVGNRLLAAAEARAAELSLGSLRLFTGEKLTANIAWYERHGFVRERIECRPDRRLVHMVKHLARARG